jgi:hypothetical protein
VCAWLARQCRLHGVEAALWSVKVLRHKVGSSSAEDPIVYEEKDEVRCN